jgi:hypothetical protein
VALARVQAGGFGIQNDLAQALGVRAGHSPRISPLTILAQPILAEKYSVHQATR